MIDTSERIGFQRAPRAQKELAIQERKQLILNFIHEFRRVKGYSPTCVQIAQGIGYSKATGGMAHMLVGQLVSEGWLTNTPNVARSILPLKDASEVYCALTDPDLKKIARQQKDLRILK